jgi:decaprenyl-phosphate phosphoribosyltransferase
VTASAPAPTLSGPEASRRQRVSLRSLVRLLRPRQWAKNAFVLAPLMFSGTFRQPRAVASSLAAFALFCIAASTGYVFNDMIDAAADAAHPIKSRTRPIAAGEVPIKWARGMFAVGLALTLAAFAWSPATALVAVIYLVLNIAYSLRLKRIPVIDIFALAAGFVLRVYAGAAAIPVPVSSWMLVTTLSLALYLAVIKRRQELIDSGPGSRAVLQSYSLALLDRYAETAALSAVVFYGLFAVTVRPRLNVTMPFVLFGLFRYWYLADSTGKGETPTELVGGDWQLIVTVIAWTAVCIWRLSPAGG